MQPMYATRLPEANRLIVRKLALSGWVIMAHAAPIRDEQVKDVTRMHVLSPPSKRLRSADVP